MYIRITQRNHHVSSPDLRAWYRELEIVMNIRISRSTHPNGSWTSKFFLQSVRECARDGRLVGIEHADDTTEPKEANNEGSNWQQRFVRRNVSVLLRAEDTQNIVVFVHRFAEVASFLLIPPSAVWIAELAFDGRRVGVVSVLRRTISSGHTMQFNMSREVPSEGRLPQPGLEEPGFERRQRGDEHSSRRFGPTARSRVVEKASAFEN